MSLPPLSAHKQNMKIGRLFANKTLQNLLTSVLGSAIMKKRQENLAILFGGFSMKKEEILEKSRAKIRIRTSLNNRF